MPSYEFPGKLAEAMKIRSLNQGDVSSRSSVLPGKLIEIARGDYTPTFEEADLIAQDGLGMKKGSSPYLDLMRARARDAKIRGSKIEITYFAGSDGLPSGITVSK